MSEQPTIVYHPQPTPLEYCDELATYIEKASCAVCVLGDLLENAEDDGLHDGQTQSLGFLLQILGDGMMQQCEAARAVIKRMADSVPKTQPG